MKTENNNEKTQTQNNTYQVVYSDGVSFGLYHCIELGGGKENRSRECKDKKLRHSLLYG